MNDNKALEALERLYKSHAENNFAPFPTRSDLDTIRLALTELAEIKKRAEERRRELGDIFTKANAENPYSVDGDDNVTYFTETEVIDFIDYILKGETK